MTARDHEGKLYPSPQSHRIVVENPLYRLYLVFIVGPDTLSWVKRSNTTSSSLFLLLEHCWIEYIEIEHIEVGHSIVLNISAEHPGVSPSGASGTTWLGSYVLHLKLLLVRSWEKTGC